VERQRPTYLATLLCGGAAATIFLGNISSPLCCVATGMSTRSFLFPFQPSHSPFSPPELSSLRPVEWSPSRFCLATANCMLLYRPYQLLSTDDSPGSVSDVNRPVRPRARRKPRRFFETGRRRTAGDMDVGQGRCFRRHRRSCCPCLLRMGWTALTLSRPSWPLDGTVDITGLRSAAGAMVLVPTLRNHQVITR
jgi:hypothetical protein